MFTKKVIGTTEQQQDVIGLFDADVGPIVEVFIDSANGRNSNNGLTSGTALQTIKEARRRFANKVMGGARIRLNFAGVGGFGDNATAQLDYVEQSLPVGGFFGFDSSYVYHGPSMVPFAPSTGPATAALDAVPAVAVGKSTRLDFTVAAPGWTVGDLKGQFCRVTRGGLLLFAEMPIANNTADTLTLRTPNIVGNLLATDTVEIVIPGARIIGPAETFQFVFIEGSGGAYNGSDPTAAGPSFFRLELGGPSFGGFFGRGELITLDRCKMSGFQSVGGYSYLNCSSSGFNGHFGKDVGQNQFLQADSLTNPILQGFNVPAVDLQVTDGRLGFGFRTDQAMYRSVYGLAVDDMPASFGAIPALVVEGPGSLLIMNEAVTGVRVADLQGASPGANAGAVGLRCRFGSMVRVNPNVTSPGSSALTAPGGDLQLESGAAISYGVGVGEFEEAAGFAGHFQRFPLTVGAQGDQSLVTTHVP